MQNNYSILLTEVYTNLLAQKGKKNVAHAIKNGTVQQYLNTHHSINEQDFLLIVEFANTFENVSKALHKFYLYQNFLSEDAVVFLMNKPHSKDLLCSYYTKFDYKTKINILKCADNELKAKLITSDSYFD